MSVLVNRFFDLSDMNDPAKKFITRSFLIIFAYTFIIMLTNTFLILFALETLTIKQLGWVLGVKFGVQALTDYPTGALGDWIGQRWVLFISSISYSVGLLILSFSSNFDQILIGFGIIGFAQGQESGSFNSWFDNNYQLYLPEDQTRQMYGQLLGKFTMMKELITAIAFIIGGFIIYFSSRHLLFNLQGFFLLFFSFLFLVFIKDHPSVPQRELHLQNYFSFFSQGLSTVYKDRNLFILILGMMITGAGMMLWAGLIMLPLYESYAKTDAKTSILRSTIWVFGAIGTGIVGVLSKRIKNIRKTLSIAFLSLDVVFFSIMLIMVSFFEPASEFKLILFLLLVIAFTVGFTARYFVDVLLPRYFLDKIPNANRNAIYSLIPTLIMIISVPYLILGGFLLQMYNIQTVLVILAVNGLIGSGLCAYGVLLKVTPVPDMEIIHKSDILSVVSA